MSFFLLSRIIMFYKVIRKWDSASIYLSIYPNINQMQGDSPEDFFLRNLYYQSFPPHFGKSALIAFIKTGRKIFISARRAISEIIRQISTSSFLVYRQIETLICSHVHVSSHLPHSCVCIVLFLMFSMKTKRHLGSH